MTLAELDLRSGRVRLRRAVPRADLRGQGLGAALLRWAVEEARRRGCALVQLTSDRGRTEAHRFYGRPGFVASHEGFELRL